MEVNGYYVDSYNRQEVPSAEENIFTDWVMDIGEFIKEVSVYRRSKDECPFARGNWVIDIFLECDGPRLIAIKLPLDMPEEAVLLYVKPLIDQLELKDKNAHH